MSPRLRPGRPARDQTARLRAVILSAAIAVAMLSGVGPAGAACTAQPDPVVAMSMADSVFVGRVVELDDLNRRATMDVVEIWKGPDLAGRVETSGAASDSPVLGPSDRTYSLGATYLVVPFGRTPPFYDDACSATSLYIPLGGRIPPQYQEAVGATTARIPAVAGPAAAAGESQGGVGVPLIIGGGAVALLGIWLVTRRRKKPGLAAKPAEAGPPPAPLSPPPAEATEGAVAPIASSNGSAAGAKRKRRRRAPRAKKTSAKSKRAAAPRAGRDRGPQSPARPPRFGKSGLSNLEAVRKKTRRIKAKQQKAKAK